jgi:uncharacterized repeat protein (TIGR03803 family)
MSIPWLKSRGVLVTLLMATATVSIAAAQEATFSTLYLFDPLDPIAYTSPLGSQPDSRPVLGPGNTVYGMSYDGGTNGNGVIYRFDLKTQAYSVLHTFSATDANGYNEDGAFPGVALTRGPDNEFYGMASFGGTNGTGTVFRISTSGEFTVLHTFSALDANRHNWDGANPLRTIVIGHDGNLYGTTRLGGQNTCGLKPFPNSCGVAWVMDRWGRKFTALHQFTATEGHAASLTLAHDGLFYGCAVWPATQLPDGTKLPSGTLFRMTPTGRAFEVLYKFSQTDASGANSDGADCYEPLVEKAPGVFYGNATNGGTNGNGAVFRYSLSNPGIVEIVHEFSAMNAYTNSDGAYPYASLTLGEDGALYSTTSLGGANTNGVVYRIGPDDAFKVLYTFSASDPITGANADGSTPDFGVILDGEDSLIGASVYGGNGNSAGYYNTGGTLYRLKLDD